MLRTGVLLNFSSTLNMEPRCFATKRRLTFNGLHDVTSEKIRVLLGINLLGMVLAVLSLRFH
jgi:hypothetical protein